MEAQKGGWIISEYSEVTKKAVARLNEHPYVARVWKQSCGDFRNLKGPGRTTVAPAGTPDIIGWTKDGRFIGIECKRKGTSTTNDAQLDTQTLLQVSRAIHGTITEAEQATAILDAAMDIRSARYA